MRVLAGIPTRLRDTSGKIADVLAKVCDEVYVVSQGATVNSISSNVTVVEKDLNYGLVAARNEILRYANEKEYDIVVQSDDDLKYNPDVIEALVQEILENPLLGAIASSSRAYFRWNEGNITNQNWVLNPCAAQLWAARRSILNEVGEWELEFLEDRYHGAKMWTLGYPIGLLHTSLSQTHNPFIARTQKGESSGGQEQGVVRQQRLQKAIETLNRDFGNIVTATIQPIGSSRTFSTRYRWDRLIQYVVDRWQYGVGYEDNRGRRM